MKIDVRNPRTGRVDYKFELPDQDFLVAECKKLRANQPAWWQLGVDGRIKKLQRFSNALKDHREAILNALVLDTGRWPLSEMELDGLRGYIDARCSHAHEVLQEHSGGNENNEVTFRQQYVPCQLLVAISPWNYPLILSFLDAIPALLAGCAVIIKPSEVTPRFIEPINEVLKDIPELDVVLGVVPGEGSVAQALIKCADAVVFTGSVATGRKVALAAADAFIPAMLELGGKDPAIVLKSADMDAAAPAIMRGAIVNTGQACFSIERIYVDALIYDEFVEKLCELAQQIEIDYPDIKHGHIGPFILAKQAEIVQRQIEDALTKGAKVLTGGIIEDHEGGLWLRPTVMVDVDHSMEIMQKETFGPVLPVMKFSTIEEAIILSNDTTYGLSAAVFGAEEVAQQVASALDAGGVYINDVDLIGEVGLYAEKNAFKLSGLGGSRYGPDGILRYLRKKALVTRHNKPDDMNVLAQN